MYASDISKRRRDLMTTFYFNNQTNNFLLSTKINSDTLISVKQGSTDLYYNGVLVPGLQGEGVTTTTTTTPVNPCIMYTLQDATLTVLDSLLTYNASISLPPTRCARNYYLFFFTITCGYNWVQSTGKVNGTKDTWNWDTHHALSSYDDVLVWMNHLYAYIMPSFVPGYNDSSILERERNNFNWSVETQNAQVARIQSEGNWTAWQAAWNAWWTYRAADGSVAAAAVPSNSVLPNGSTSLNVTTSQDFTDVAAYPNPTQWTPLLVGGARKNYLTYTWETVTSSCLSGLDDSSLKYSGQTSMPNTAGRQTEIADLVDLANDLNDEQKAIAEFWAGGPFTVAPPGMFVWFWKEYMLSTNTTANHDYTSFFYSAFELGIQLFEISRLVWGLKKDNMQARPIQDIRRLYASVPADGTLKNYDGTNIAGNVWVPYQVTTFVTPPFADFPSGHSGFSQCFANVMTKWFGPSIPSTAAYTVSDLSLLSKMFTGVTQTLPFGSYTIPAGVSEIQTGIVPATPITLTWTNWQDIATSAGVSRQYGGIHCISANTGSQVVANNLLSYVNTNWGITV